MEEMKTKKKTRRAQNPFDDGAAERLYRMGLLAKDRSANKPALIALSAVYAGAMFDMLCDYYHDYAWVQEDLSQLFAAAETADERQKFLLICLQYDGLGLALPDPVWWISGNGVLTGVFADAYIRHLKQLNDAAEVF